MTRASPTTLLTDRAAGEVLEAFDLLGWETDRKLVFWLAWWLVVHGRSKA